MKKLIKRKYKVILRRYFYKTETGWLEDAKEIVTDTVLMVTKKRFEAERCFNQAMACHYIEGTTYKGQYYPNVMIILEDSQGGYIKWEN